MKSAATDGRFLICALTDERTSTGWRPGSESNRRTRLCRPLHDHSATWPSVLEIAASLAAEPLKNKTSACPRLRLLEACNHGWPLLLHAFTDERKKWSGKRDSNSRPRPWQGRALPTELFPREPHIIRVIRHMATLDRALSARTQGRPGGSKVHQAGPDRQRSGESEQDFADVE